MDDAPQFPRFPELPAELQNQIWTWACFLSRNIDVKFEDVSDRIGMDYDNILIRYKSPTPAPSVLHTCHESRKVGLEYYCLTLETDVEDKRGEVTIHFSIPSQIYINDDCDIVRPLCFETQEDERSDRDWYVRNCWWDFVLYDHKRVALTTRSIGIWMKSSPPKTLNAEEVLIYWEPVAPVSQVRNSPIARTQEEEREPYEFVSLEEHIDEKLLLLGAYPEVKEDLLKAQVIAKKAFRNSVVKLVFRMRLKDKKDLMMRVKDKKDLAMRERLARTMLSSASSTPALVADEQ